LPPAAPTTEADAVLFASEPWVNAPIHVDYGCNIKLGAGVFLNFNTTFVDTCPITIGARTIVGPNCSFYSGTHPLDPALRNGTEGPELGKEIYVGEDCWFGGNVIVLPGVRIGKGCSIGAGSVVTKVKIRHPSLHLTFLSSKFSSTLLRTCPRST
jgi:acetyltransferase-like isoleucine patch superfamily enzyme